MGKMAQASVEARRRSDARRCSVGVFAKSLSEEDLKDFQELLADTEVSGNSIREVIDEEFSVDLSVSSINFHRRGGCKCR